METWKPKPAVCPSLILSHTHLRRAALVSLSMVGLRASKVVGHELQCLYPGFVVAQLPGPQKQKAEPFAVTTGPNARHQKVKRSLWARGADLFWEVVSDFLGFFGQVRSSTAGLAV